MMVARKVRIAVLAYDGMITGQTTLALIDACEQARVMGWECGVDIRPSDTMIARGRNYMLANFLEDREATDLVFWDADIMPEPRAFTHLVSREVDFVGGAYRARKDPEEYIYRKTTPIPHTEVSGLMEVDGLGMGFTRITRAAVERMVEFHSTRWLLDNGRKIPWLFDFEFKDHEYYSEDIAFCERWRETGGKVWIDPDMSIAHVGRKVFFGHYGRHRRRRLAAMTPQSELDAASERMAALQREIEARE